MIIKNTSKYHIDQNRKTYHYIDTKMLCSSKSQLILQSSVPTTKSELTNLLGSEIVQTLEYPKEEEIPEMEPIIFSTPSVLPNYVDRYNAVIAFNQLLAKILTLQHLPDITATTVDDYTHDQLDYVYSLQELNKLSEYQLKRLRNLSHFTSAITPTIHEFVVPISAISHFIDDFIQVFPSEMDKEDSDKYDQVKEFLENYDVSTLFPQHVHTIIFLSRAVPYCMNQNEIQKFLPLQAVEIGESLKLNFQKIGNAIFGYDLASNNKFYIFDHALFYLMEEEKQQLVPALAQLVTRGIYGEGYTDVQPLMGIFSDHELLEKVLEYLYDNSQILLYYQNQEELLQNSDTISKEGHNTHLQEFVV
jgi:hypothetical protein